MEQYSAKAPRAVTLPSRLVLQKTEAGPSWAHWAPASALSSTLVTKCDEACTGLGWAWKQPERLDFLVFLAADHVIRA